MDYLEKVIVPRFQDIIKGACLMTGTTCETERSYPFQAKIPCLTLNDLIMENARKFEAPQLAGPREKTGSTDFGNVMYDVPGCCIRTAFVPEGTAAHSQEYLDAGKTERAHEAIRSGSEILETDQRGISEAETGRNRKNMTKLSFSSHEQLNCCL